eukprot:TRINITY_DN24122_c0_g1_i1.p1 TRINITY_DN24122_c0_g1~~TRINITY_DN24122_c0_g1_i1.p1  ORF type:complete len:1374 (-),score=210.11 TRINITY_DN24122_c0_g1_i1:86-4207(-)
MADVDDIWLDMQREQASAPRGLKGKPKTTFDLSSLQREKTKGKKVTTKKQLDASLQWMQNWSANLKVEGNDYKVASVGGQEDTSIAMEEPPATLLDANLDIPTGTPETFLAFVQRDINCLAEDNLSVRLQSMNKLERLLVQQIDNLPTDIIDAVCDALLKPLLKQMKDKSEKIREMAVTILRSLIENTSDLSGTLAYIFPILVSRLGCEDLDGVAHLPEIMRPEPEQKPTVIARPVEESEEVRLHLARLVAALLSRLSPTQAYSYVDEATGLVRAGAMDPYHEVKVFSCETMIAFCYNHTEMLLHFALPLARSLTSCLAHNHAKLRIAALKAVTACLFCGIWKHNFEIFQVLMAWQDPNKVPVKAFYEGVTNVNYMSTLSFDRHPAVRRFWFETLAYWMLRCVDKVDLEPYIVPYLLTALCDENEEIALEVFWLIEAIGEAYEEEHEKDLRKTKQYGFDYSWTYSGRASVPFPLQGAWGGGKSVSAHLRRIGGQGPDMLGERSRTDHHHREKLDEMDEREDEHALEELSEGEDDEGAKVRSKLGRPLQLPKRDYCWGNIADLKVYARLPRPRLGSRAWIRTHARRYIKATFNDVVDFRDCTSLNAGRLLCMSVAYTEEGVTEWLQPMMAALQKFYSGRAWAAGDSEVMQTYTTVCKLLGCFLEPIAIWGQLKTALDPDSVLELDQRIASVRILSFCIEGHIETLQSVQPPDPDLGLGLLEPVMPELISMMHESDLLLSPTPASRDALWALLFSFLEPLRPLLSAEQVSQLLFVALALAAKPPSDEASEPAMSSSKGKASKVPSNEGLLPMDLEAEELVDPDKLDRALAALSKGLDETLSAGSQPGRAPALPAYSLDSLEDDDVDSAHAVEAESGIEHESMRGVLFERAFLDVMEKLDDSFQVFRSVLYLTPLSVFVKAAHQEVVLRNLSSFAGPLANAPTRSAALTLGAQLCLRCTKQIEKVGADSHLGKACCTFIWGAFQVMGKAHQGAMAAPYHSLSFSVIMSGLSGWRHFFLQASVDIRLALFPCRRSKEEASQPMRWIVSTLADQELYKRFHLSAQHAETVLTGRTPDDFVVEKARSLREQSERHGVVARCMAASTLLVGLRRMLMDGRGTYLPWNPGSSAGSLQGLFKGAASLLTQAQPSMDPPFVKPTPPGMLLYAAELLHVLFNLPHDSDSDQESRQAVAVASSPFKLLDDAARAIHHLPAPPSRPRLPRGLRLSMVEEEQLVADYIQALLDLNLTLPPDPNAKYTPASMDEGAGDIILGWDDSLPSSTSSSSSSDAPKEDSSRCKTGLPAEVSRLLAQSPECQRWNAALALYIFGVDLAATLKDAFDRNIMKWRKRKEQAKLLLAQDVLLRSAKALSSQNQSLER